MCVYTISQITSCLFIFLPSQPWLSNTPITSLQKGKTPPMSAQVMTLNNLMVRPSNAGALGNVESPFIAITTRSTLARSGST